MHYVVLMGYVMYFNSSTKRVSVKANSFLYINSNIHFFMGVSVTFDTALFIIEKYL